MKRLLGIVGLAVAAFGLTYGITAIVNRLNAPTGMFWIPGGEFTMGSDVDFGWPDESPAHRVQVNGFWMDATEVTNAEFRKFVEATKYVTTAERPIDINELMKQVPPGTPPPPPEKLKPGSLVFRPTAGPVDTRNFAQWWHWVPGACWKHPEGPQSNLEGRDQHPVVQVSWDDAVAYAKWAGKRLPTEAEWERAARGGLEKQPFVWGDAKLSDDQPQCNIWQGEFPFNNTKKDRFDRTAPVGSFPANGYGLYDMAGNVWEWCSDWYDRDLHKRSGGRLTFNPQGPEKTYDPMHPFEQRRVQKGGSFLCNDSYCSRYRPSARHGCTPDSGMSHVGFRCVKQ